MLMPQAVLQVRNVNVHYGDLQAIWNVEMTLEAGKIVSMIGANGAGKSTLLQAISGALTPSSGEIIYKGETINGLAPYQVLPLGISLVPEGRRIFPRLTVLENLLVGAYHHKARANHKQVLEKVFRLFPILGERTSQLGINLSGGEQQMLAIARSLMSDPDIILIDEISLGLAPAVVKKIYEALKTINRLGKTMILVEQDLQKSMKMADYIYVLQKGRIVLHGDPAGLSEEEVKKAYFGI
jgi:branched-chain amino acid transport system ATP-binding protein